MAVKMEINAKAVKLNIKTSRMRVAKKNRSYSASRHIVSLEICKAAMSCGRIHIGLYIRHTVLLHNVLTMCARPQGFSSRISIRYIDSMRLETEGFQGTGKW